MTDDRNRAIEELFLFSTKSKSHIIFFEVTGDEKWDDAPTCMGCTHAHTVVEWGDPAAGDALSAESPIITVTLRLEHVQRVNNLSVCVQ